MLKSVLFDIDGTITDTNPIFLDAIVQTHYEMTGQQKNREFFHFSLGIPSPVTLGILDIPQEFRMLYIQRWQEHIKEKMHKVVLFPRIVTVLESLREWGLSMALVTSKVRSEFSFQFDSFGLNHFFQAIICADDASRPKPNPDPLFEACSRLGVKPREAIYVGDSRYDIMAAKAAGIPFLFASWGSIDPNSVLELHPEFYLKEPIEILDVVQKKTQVEIPTQLNYQNM
ncbi:MAG TPA: HAD family hydrolase [Atribacter sp.]|jgi:HAD superfamily hydrolase (TIGR01509 family)|uniref:HAD family hydrolase n=1 Tax=Atribacter sp. TaxID=2847780 RepID=UPI002C560797|nr:HAD family hydrolase [Atribacter sp.]HQK83861.1 HAD family hydrolase [Atribacter sp.]